MLSKVVPLPDDGLEEEIELDKPLPDPVDLAHRRFIRAILTQAAHDALEPIAYMRDGTRNQEQAGYKASARQLLCEIAAKHGRRTMVEKQLEGLI